MMRGWEFDHELTWPWWTFGVRYRNPPYGDTEVLVGIGPLLLVWIRRAEVRR